MNTLSTEQTSHILQRAQQRANQLQVKATIAIVDAGAHLKAFIAMDGARPGPIDVCQRKARTSALFGCNSGDFGNIIIEHQLVGMENSNNGLAPFPGGIPITIEGTVVGAIGVSGGSAAQDQQIAEFALQQD